jgi:hypothetical protein
MKLHKIFRVQAIGMGIVAALFFASSAPAQEIENTRWNEGPNVAAFEQPAPAANGLKTSVVNPSASTTAVIAKPVAAQEPVIAPLSPVQGVIAFSLVFMTLTALYRLAQAKRTDRNPEAGTDQANRLAVLS